MLQQDLALQRKMLALHLSLRLQAIGSTPCELLHALIVQILLRVLGDVGWQSNKLSYD